MHSPHRNCLYYCVLHRQAVSLPRITAVCVVSVFLPRGGLQVHTRRYSKIRAPATASGSSDTGTRVDDVKQSYAPCFLCVFFQTTTNHFQRSVQHHSRRPLLFKIPIECGPKAPRAARQPNSTQHYPTHYPTLPNTTTVSGRSSDLDSQSSS